MRRRPSAAAADDLSANELYKAARTAVGENRMVEPPGNNALEYYLRILAKQPDDSSATDALRELFPFATAGAEDQINQGNFDEATRIMALLAKADPSNYTLTILRSKLDAKKKQNDRGPAVAGAAGCRRGRACNRYGASAGRDGCGRSRADGRDRCGDARACRCAARSAGAGSRACDAATCSAAAGAGTRTGRRIARCARGHAAAAELSGRSGAPVARTAGSKSNSPWPPTARCRTPRWSVRNLRARSIAKRSMRSKRRVSNRGWTREKPVAATLRRRIEFKLNN